MEFRRASDAEALEGLRVFARREGVIFALESAHAAAAALDLAPELPPEAAVVVNMSGRGDKDLFIAARELAPEAWKAFLREEEASI